MRKGGKETNCSFNRLIEVFLDEFFIALYNRLSNELNLSKCM